MNLKKSEKDFILIYVIKPHRMSRRVAKLSSHLWGFSFFKMR